MRIIMGKRDYRHREPKKPKKDIKKTVISSILPASSGVEIVKKKKKVRKEDEEE